MAASSPFETVIELVLVLDFHWRGAPRFVLSIGFFRDLRSGLLEGGDASEPGTTRTSHWLARVTALILAEKIEFEDEFEFDYDWENSNRENCHLRNAAI
jgi:hypothetical protein